MPVGKSIWPTFATVLEEAVFKLCKAVTSVNSETITLQESFLWGLVASCCSRINVDRDNLDWVYRYNQVLKQIGSIFQVYSNENDLSDGQFIIIQDYPEQVTKHHLKDAKRYDKIVVAICMPFCNHYCVN